MMPHSSLPSSPSEQILKDLSFCVIDLETTGGNHQYDKIIEIGLIKIEQGKITAEMSFLINPEIPIPEFIQKLTSIHEEEIKGAPKIEETIERILHFMGEAILVAHNSSFDIPFFNSVLKRLKRPVLTNKTLCTNLLTKNLIPEIINSNLPYLTRLFQIEHHKAHRALEDAKATAHLLLFFLNIFSEKNIKKINQIYYPRNKYELDTCHFKNIAELLSLQEKLERIPIPMTAIIKGEKGVLIDILPMRSFAEDKDYFFNVFLQRPWTTLTIKLCSSLVMSFSTIFSQINKLHQDYFDETLTYLEKKYDIAPNKPSEESALNLDEVLFITPHLIPEQMVALALNTHFQKKDFIFRYPSHQQKFFQHISKVHKKYVHYKNSMKSVERERERMREKVLINENDGEKEKSEKELIQELLAQRFRYFLSNFFSSKHAPDLFIITISQIDKNEYEGAKSNLVRFLTGLEHHNLYNFPINHL